MKDDTIQTLHPDKNKSNKSISKRQHDHIKEAILKILRSTSPTHTELIQELQHNLRKKFDGNIAWYGMTVKLDLESRGVIRRTKSRLPRYELSRKQTC